jgi:2-dehydropantoate 2-reductase
VRLAEAGVAVICVARPETAAAIAHEGLTLEAAGRTLRAQPEAVERLAEPVDLLLVTVKAPHLDASLDRVEASAGVVLPLLNGLEHVTAIRARLGRRVAPGSISRFEAYRDGPTRIVQTTMSGVVTMASDDLSRADLERAAELLGRAGLQTAVSTSEKAVLWEKVARLAVLSPATALTQRPVAELAADPEWRPVLVAAIAEACAVAAADGAPLATEAHWAIIDAMPETLTTSTARDVAAGRPSELDAITGAVIRAGRRLGVATPTLDDLLGQCRASSL